ncbi:MAG: hypothetical protein R2941_12040 [Desulfobacterales bacterium]
MKKQPFLHGKRILRFEALQHCLVPMSRGFSIAQKEESRRLINETCWKLSPGKPHPACFVLTY